MGYYYYYTRQFFFTIEKLKSNREQRNITNNNCKQFCSAGFIVYKCTFNQIIFDQAMTP